MTVSRLDLVVYDDTCRGRTPFPGLTHSWIAGTRLFGLARHVDAWFPARDWSSALAWLGDVRTGASIRSVQFWGHGKWGRALIDGDPLDDTVLDPDHSLHDALDRVRRRFVDSGGYWWFRTCETFGADAGHAFARRWADFLDVPVASHTYIIGPFQSGLHVLHPGDTPDWPRDEGLVEGTPESPERAAWSTPTAPNTVSCLRPHLPDRQPRV